MFMSFVRANADTSPTRTDLRLVVLAQWVRAGLAMVRGATTTGRGLVGGAIALWRLAQAVRLAILLARRLADAAGAPSPITEAEAQEAGLAFPSELFVPLEGPPANAAALSHALAEIAATIANALDRAPHGRASDWDREPSGSPLRRAALMARGPSRRPRRTPPCGLRPLRPPGPDRSGRRRSRPALTLQTPLPPIAPLAVGRRPLAWA